MKISKKNLLLRIAYLPERYIPNEITTCDLLTRLLMLPAIILLTIFILPAILLSYVFKEKVHLPAVFYKDILEFELVQSVINGTCRKIEVVE